MIHKIFETLHKELSIALSDIEIVIMESPANSWGFRGWCGDEIEHNYDINV